MLFAEQETSFLIIVGIILIIQLTMWILVGDLSVLWIRNEPQVKNIFVCLHTIFSEGNVEANFLFAVEVKCILAVWFQEFENLCYIIFGF